MKFLRQFIAVVAAVVLLTGCKDKDKDEPQPPQPPLSTDATTVLVYMAANNSLGTAGADAADISEMQQAARAGLKGDNRWLIFHAATDGSQVLSELMADGTLATLRTYDGSQYSIAADFMSGVFRDARNAAPANHYGLIMWSHALGWTQNGQVDDGPTADTKTWGDDRGHTMNISTLRRVLEARRWDWVYFDCCYMGSVEVTYELRHATDFMVASESEVPLDGMPYTENMPLLLSPRPDLVGAAQNTFEYYDNRTGKDRTCTIAVIDLRGMDALAEATKAVYEASQTGMYLGQMTNQPLSIEVRPLFYDFGIFVDGLCLTNNLAPELQDAYTAALSSVVMYKRQTPTLWGQLPLKPLSGLSTFIPTNKSQLTFRNYNTLEWYTDVAEKLYEK